MFHLAAYNYTSTNTGAGVFVNISAVQDQYLTKNANNRYILPAAYPGQPILDRIAASYAMGTTMTVARLRAPSLRNPSLPSISPINPGSTIPNAFNFQVYGPHGPRLKLTEEFGVEGDAAAVEVQTAMLILHDGMMNVAPLPIVSVQFSATITTVLNTWTPGTITLAQDLTPGEYEVVGMDFVGTTAIFGRLLFSNGGPRPGVPGRASLAIFPQNQFRNGNFGTFGRFTQYSLPGFEVFASSAAAITFTGVLDLIQRTQG